MSSPTESRLPTTPGRSFPAVVTVAIVLPMQHSNAQRSVYVNGPLRWVDDVFQPVLQSANRARMILMLPKQHALIVTMGGMRATESAKARHTTVTLNIELCRLM